MFHSLTELNSQRDALQSVRNVYLHRKVCRVATGSNLSGFFSVIVSFTSTVLELIKLAFEIMLQELPVKVVLKSSLIRKISQLRVSSAVRMFSLAVFHPLGNNCTTEISRILRANKHERGMWSSAFRRGQIYILFSRIICAPLWGSLAVLGSFVIQFGDSLRSRDHLRRYTNLFLLPCELRHSESHLYLATT